MTPGRPASIDDDVLAAFVPRLATELDELGSPSWTLVDGSMLSADISGFTALSERLAGKGKAGAEEITTLVNTCFTALIAAAYRYGGEVIKFGGDALLVLFRGDNHERRSVDAGLAMQRTLHSSSAAKRARLTMTVGVADGPFDVYLAGSEYRELLIAGGQATEVIRLEGEAGKADTLVSKALAARLPAHMRVRRAAGGVVVSGTTGDPPPGPAPRHHAGVDLTPFVPASVREQLAAFAGLGGEHRLVTVGFLMVAGLDALRETNGPSTVAQLLHRLVDDVVAIATTYGVTPLHTDIAPDGVKFVLCAGAPVNPGDTADAMLRCALQLAEIDTPFALRQGVQTGRVFAGFLGSEFRRTYTLMGDPVNTAARMIGKADDREIVAVASVVNDTRSVFITDRLEPFTVKGKSEPIVAHRVVALSDEVRRDNTTTRLFGRQSELDVLTRAIGELGEVVVLSGGAGVGKSRLLDAAWDAAEGLRVYQGACTPFGASTPYSVFRPLLRMGAGIDIYASADDAGELLTKIVKQSAPDLQPMLPLLAIPLGARVGSTPEADVIDPEFRRLRIHETVVSFLDATLDGPILLVVEDAHWIDDASGDLVNHLIDAAPGRPWASVITRRPEGGWAPPDAPHVATLDLEPLDARAVRELAIAVSTRPLGDRDLDLIVERSGGNPLFAIELARALAITEGAELPDTIEQLIAARFDRLAPDARQLVRVASVLGTTFDTTVVSAMLDDTEASDRVRRALDDASLAGAVVQRSGTTWAFAHALYRDTVYAGLPFNRRKRLHRSAAEIIELNTTDPDGTAETLSLHYGAARHHQKTWQYSLVAARVAESQHATNEAALAYERGLVAARYCRHVTSTQRMEIAERLADQYYVLGRFDDATQLYGYARRSQPDLIDVARLVRKQASVFERQGRPNRSLRWYARARRFVPETIDGEAWWSERAQVALGEAGIRARQGDNRRCLTLARQALVDAERSGDRRSQALALERIHLALVFMIEPDVDACGHRALEAHQLLDDLNGMARTLINLGVESYFASRWSESSDYYLQALTVANRASSVVLAANAATNSAEVLADLGEWDQSIELLGEAMRNYGSVGYAPGIAAAKLFAAVGAMRRGDLRSAQSLLDESRAELHRLEMFEMLQDLDTRQLELELLSGTATPARCKAVKRQLDHNHPLSARVDRISGLAEHLAGNDQGARELLTKTLGDTSLAEFERALTLRSLVLVAPDDPQADVWQAQAEAILQNLSVVRAPPLVAGDFVATAP